MHCEGGSALRLARKHGGEHLLELLKQLGRWGGGSRIYALGPRISEFGPCALGSGSGFGILSFRPPTAPSTGKELRFL